MLLTDTPSSELKLRAHEAAYVSSTTSLLKMPHRQLASSCSTQSGVIDFLADNGKDMIGKIRHSDDVPGPKEQVK